MFFVVCAIRTSILKQILGLPACHKKSLEHLAMLLSNWCIKTIRLASQMVKHDHRRTITNRHIAGAADLVGGVQSL